MRSACNTHQPQASISPRCAALNKSWQPQFGRLGRRISGPAFGLHARQTLIMRSHQTEGPTESRPAMDRQPDGAEHSKPQQEPAPPQQPGGMQPTEPDDMDKQLSALWTDMKKQLKKDADPESAKLIDQLSYEDLVGPNSGNFFRQLAEAQLGPILAAMGIDEDPFDFFVEVIKLATFLQFVTCGMLFYGTELWAHLDTGDAFRCTAGLALGYLSRPFFKVEQLLYPVYNGVLRLFLPNATYEVPPSTSTETTATINKLGIFVALTFFLPQLFWGWDTSESTAFVGPLSLGWLLFDASYMGALLLLLRSDD